MKIDVTGFMRNTLTQRIKRSKAAVAKKLKHIAALEKELAKLKKRK